MGWHRWSVRAPNRHDVVSTSTTADNASDCTPKSLSLYDTSPSLVGTLPCSDSAMDVFVPESQYPVDDGKTATINDGVSTPKTDITMDFIVQTSLRQRKVRTVDRVVGRERKTSAVSSDLISALASPIKNYGLLGDSLLFGFDNDDDDDNDKKTTFHRLSKSHVMSPKKLFTTSPNLLTSTPIIASKQRHENVPLNHIKDIVNDELSRTRLLPTDTYCTQILFDTPEETVAAVGEHYSGHSPVFLPASFEALNIGCVISEPDIPSPTVNKLENVPPTTVRTIAVETSHTSVKKRSRFRSSPPSDPPATGNSHKRRRVSFAAGTCLPSLSTLDTTPSTPNTPSTVSTASVLSSIDNGRLEKKYLDKHRLKVVSTPTVKYEIPGSALNSAVQSGVIKPKQPNGKKSSLGNKTPSATPKTPTSALSKSVVCKEPKAPITTEKQNCNLTDCVWARWKPDKPHFLVPADLLEQSGSSTRNIWKARLHLSSNATVTLSIGDFVRMSEVSLIGLKCRLTKKPTVIVTIVSWTSSRIVGVRRDDTNDLMTVPSRHLYLDSTDLLTLRPLQTTEPTSQESPPLSKLFQHMRFLITSGTVAAGQPKSSLEDIIKRHGGTVIERIDDRMSTTNVTLITCQPPKRTFKYLMAIILGIPRVHLQWLTDCVEKGVKWPTRSPAYTVDSLRDNDDAQSSRPLHQQTWCVNRDKETRAFYAEFTVILRALGATLCNEKADCEYWLVSTLVGGRRHAKGRVVVAEQLVDCIVKNDFTTIA